MPDREWWSVLWSDPEGVLKKLGVPRGEASVDLCSGDGYFTATLSRLAAPGKVYEPEMASETAQRAREYLSACGRGNCVVIEDDARNLAAHLPEPVGFALIANTLHGIPDPDRRNLVHKVYEMVKPGGRFGIINWHPLPREQTPVLDEPRGPPTRMRMSLGQTRAAVEPAGFRSEDVVSLPTSMVWSLRATSSSLRFREISMPEARFPGRNLSGNPVNRVAA
jgi:predicted methyltransferase